jgi:maltose alpha-D-glucosyltransferase / alpha-amylase
MATLTRPRARQDRATEERLWYKDAVIYEMHVRAFFDSNGDGIGDFRGLTEKLDYLHDLGVTAIWLLPFYPSPLMDDGYDIADYTGVHPAYGSLPDVRRFIREAHRRGLKVVTELVCNHTSDQHPWFQRARRAKPGSSARDFYVWSDDPDKYRDARVIFKDFETSNWTWDPVAQAYYWHRFYRHQPDLNFENPQVRNAIFRALDFWMEMGVDGLRLDAVPYLYEREGTNCENLAETYEYLRQLRAHIDSRFENRMLLAEANQWPEDAVAYFGEGDMCHMAFHFPLMPRLFMSIHMEDRFPIIDIMRQTPHIPESSQWALFLRNHDELTLEMVTDEERDYMYRVYAVEPQMRINLGIRRRLAPLLGNHRRRVELMNGLLFSLPGTPVIYYGDEIGMGDNVYLGDRNGVRTPMQWSADRNAGFSRANPQSLYLPIIIDPEYHYETVNVEAQLSNPHSLLWWMKRLIALRKRYKAFGRGTLDFLHPENRKVLAFTRTFEDEKILVVANLSRFAQGVELDLSGYRGLVPHEMFGRVEFPAIGELPYFVTVGPHSFYWFSLEPKRTSMRVGREPGTEIPVLPVRRSWEELFVEDGDRALSRVLPEFLMAQRWFAGKNRHIRSASLTESLPLRFETSRLRIAIVQVQYTEGDGEDYLLPVNFESGTDARRRLRDYANSVIARIRVGGEGEEGVIFDAVGDEALSENLLRLIAGGRRIRGEEGELVGTRLRSFRRIVGTDSSSLRGSLVRTEQSNSSIVFGDKLFMKLFRKLEPGVNPDLEIGRYLTDRKFMNSPRVTGAIEYFRGRRPPVTIAIVNELVSHEGDAWSYTLDTLEEFFERCLAVAGEVTPPPLTARSLLDLTEQQPSAHEMDMIGAYLESARLLGKRTGELHNLLAAADETANIIPEPFSPHYQRSLYQSMRNLTTRNFRMLEQVLREKGEELPPEAPKLLLVEDEVLRVFQAVISRPIGGKRIRIHGDFHLGQVLYTGNDFVIIDFEGEPARPITERRLKRSPLLDVAGMLRSFNYAVYSVLEKQRETGLREPAGSDLEAWGQFWNAWVSRTFLRAYLEATAGNDALPRKREDIEMLLDVFLLEKAVYELGYELNNRPSWVHIPIKGIMSLLRPAEES